jgi:hypothetical protein
VGMQLCTYSNFNLTKISFFCNWGNYIELFAQSLKDSNCAWFKVQTKAANGEVASRPSR